MNGFDFLNLVIGLIFIYLIYSIAASTIFEIIISLTNMRGRMLVKWLCDNFSELTDEDPEKKGRLRNKIIEHPLVKSMVRKYDKIPSYISSEVFADTLFDLLVNEDSEDKVSGDKVIDINLLKKTLEVTNSLSPSLRRVFLQYINEAAGSIEKLKEKIGKWFDEAQQRLIGSYKKSLQLWIFVISLILVGATNADTIKLASYLYSNPEAREALAGQAVETVTDSTFAQNLPVMDSSVVDSIAGMGEDELASNVDQGTEKVKESMEVLYEAGIPIGWEQGELKSLSALEILKKIGGLLLTVFAVSLGAPFWFDILSKLANLRSSGNKPKTVMEEKEIIAKIQKPDK